MKKKVLLSSIVTIAICLCLIAGSTFALFTSTSKVNIAVQAGEVKMLASISDLQLYSVEAKDGGSVVDENGNTYEYKAVSQFTNGGTATFSESVLTIDKITPGDKVTFNVTGSNTSDIAIQYRYIVECLDGYKLMDGLVITVGDDVCESLLSYTSPYATLAAEQAMQSVPVTIELPVQAGNEYQAQTTEIRVVVEAIQGNAVVSDATEPTIVQIPKVTTPEELAAAMADPELKAVNVMSDMGALTIDYDLKDKTIWANGNDVALTFTGNLENVVVDGIVADAAGRSINVKDATGDITITNCKLISAAGTSGSAIGHGPNVNVTVDNCELVSGGGKTYGMYYQGGSGSLIITNSTFEGFGSWAITSNGTITGDVVIDNCVFNTPDGVFKTLGGGITGDFTFTNNTMNAAGHDGNINKLVVSGSGTGPVICGGTKTVEGNTLNGEAWTQE